jgi:hypothetical protein
MRVSKESSRQSFQISVCRRFSPSDGVWCRAEIQSVCRGHGSTSKEMQIANSSRVTGHQCAHIRRDTSLLSWHYLRRLGRVDHGSACMPAYPRCSGNGFDMLHGHDRPMPCRANILQTNESPVTMPGNQNANDMSPVRSVGACMFELHPREPAVQTRSRLGCGDWGATRAAERTVRESRR